MTLRIIIRTDDVHMAAHIGGAVLTSYSTTDIEAPEVERLLRNNGQFIQTQIIGVEVLAGAPALEVEG